MARANADPIEVRETLQSVIPEGDRPLTHVEAIGAWAMGLALRHQRHLGDAEALLRRALRSLVVGSDDHTGAALTLSGTLAFGGRFDDATAVLDSCVASPGIAGRVLFQRAAMSEHRGQLVEARHGYESSLVSFRAHHDRLGEAHALCGVGLVRVAEANAAEALVDFGLARSIYLELDMALLAAIAQQNLGFAALRAGDIAAAMTHLASAEHDVASFGEPFVEIGLDRVEALLVAGFVHEAIDRAAAVSKAMENHQLDADRSSMLLGLARSLGRAGQRDLARRYLDAAATLLEQQDRPHAQRVVRIRQIELADDTSADLVELARLSDELLADGHIDEAANADLVVIDLAVQRSDHHALAAAGRRLSALPATDWRHLVGHAAVAEAAGDVAKTTDAALTMLARTGGGTGGLSLDLRAGLIAHRRRTVDAALRVASEAGSSDAIVRLVAAMQRHIVPAARLRSVGPGISSEILVALRSEPSASEWRKLADALRTGGAVSGPDRQPATVALLPVDDASQVVPQAAGSPVYIVADHGDAVTTVRLDQSMTIVDRRDRQPVLDAFRRFHAALTRWSAEPPTDRAARQLDELAAEITRVFPWLAEQASAISVCATGEFAGCPWAGVAGRPVRLVVDLDPIDPSERLVSDSASSHLLVAGPGLRSADDEIERLRQALGDPLVLRGSDATPQRVADSITAVDTLHLACHASHNTANPLLSSYRLTSGDLTGYEIDRMRQVPRLVVAAACRAGQASAPTSAMALGTASAWLAAGTVTVIAPTCSIPDDRRTVEAAVRLHESLTAGVSGEEAVFELRHSTDAAVARSFQTVGRRVGAVRPPTEQVSEAH